MISPNLCQKPLLGRRTNSTRSPIVAPDIGAAMYIGILNTSRPRKAPPTIARKIRNCKGFTTDVFMDSIDSSPTRPEGHRLVAQSWRCSNSGGVRHSFHPNLSGPSIPTRFPLLDPHRSNNAGSCSTVTARATRSHLCEHHADVGHPVLLVSMRPDSCAA